jgi:hypothetical protein
MKYLPQPYIFVMFRHYEVQFIFLLFAFPIMPDSPLYHVDYLIDSGDLGRAYEILNCQNSRHNPRDKACKGCKSHEIEKVKSKVRTHPNNQIRKNVYTILESEAPIKLPSSITLPLDAIKYHCAVKDYISKRKELQKIATSQGK